MGAAETKASVAEALLGAYAAPPAAASWAEAARADARARFLAAGAPTRRDEYWRYTDPALLTDPSRPKAAAAAPVESPVFEEIDALRLVFVDGRFDPAQSSPLEEAGIEIQPLAEALTADIHWARDLFGALETAGQDPVTRPLAALNTAVVAEGFAIRVTGAPKRPVHFRYLHEDPTSDAAIRHLVKVEAGGEITILENGPAAARFNKCMEIDVADDAACRHIRAQGRDHERLAATAMFARLGARSKFQSFTLTVNGRLTRNEVVIEFTGDDASGHVAGACIGADDFHHDDTVFVTHDAVNCESRQVFKKVLKAGARGVFQGKILVQPGAQKTDGYQISQSLLLDDDAEFNAKPELEIYADDVACSHGSTSGAVDEEQLFYLRARGVPMEEAKNMMVLAFVDEAVQEIEDDTLADEIRGRIGAWLERHTGA